MATTGSISSSANSPTALPNAGSTSSAAKTAATIVKSLNAGSGIDTQSLADSLVAAERAPKQAAIDKNIQKNNDVVSGMSALKYVLNNLKTAFDDLKDVSDYKNMTVSSDQSLVTATADAGASAGSHSIVVKSLAQGQRDVLSPQVPTTTSKLNNGAAMALTLGGNAFPDGQSISVPAGQDTPQGVVDAINSANVGLTAHLVNTGMGSNPYKIVVNGGNGVDKSFTLSGLGDANAGQGQAAQDAELTVDGVQVSSATNTVSGVIPGVSLTLRGTNYPQSTSLVLANDTTQVTARVNALVTAYNDASSLMNEVTNPKSTLATYGATMVGNSTVQRLRDEMRQMVQVRSDTAPSNNVAYMHDIGVQIDSKGVMTVDSVKLGTAVNTDFSNTVKLLTGNQEQLSQYAVATPAGIAGVASRKLSAMLSSTGSLSTESSNATSNVSKYQDDLKKLDDRMQRLLERYSKQFAAMDSIVGQSKSTQTGLTSTFAGLMAMYTNK
jgi:flagellar hook-associated protein 2